MSRYIIKGNIKVNLKYKSVKYRNNLVYYAKIYVIYTIRLDI